MTASTLKASQPISQPTDCVVWSTAILSFTLRHFSSVLLFSTLPLCLSRAKSAVTLSLSLSLSLSPGVAPTQRTDTHSHPCIPFTNHSQPDSKLVNRFFGHEWMNESSTSGPFSTRIVIYFWKFFNGKRKKKHFCCDQKQSFSAKCFQQCCQRGKKLLVSPSVVDTNEKSKR